MNNTEKADDISVKDTRSVELQQNPSQQKGIIAVDTVHKDEALKILANYHGDLEWTEAEEKALVRKIDLRLLPILCLTYGLQCKSPNSSESACLHTCSMRRQLQLLTEA